MSDQSTPRMRQLEGMAKEGSEGAAVLWLLLHDKPTHEQDQVLEELGRKMSAMFRHVREVMRTLQRLGAIDVDPERYSEPTDYGGEPF